MSRLKTISSEERGNSESLFDEEFDNDGLLKPVSIFIITKESNS